MLFWIGICFAVLWIVLILAERSHKCNYWRAHSRRHETIDCEFHRRRDEQTLAKN